MADKPDDQPQGMIGNKPYWCAVGVGEGGKVSGMADKEGNCTFAYRGE